MRVAQLEAFYRRHGLPHPKTLAKRFCETHLLGTRGIHPAVVMKEGLETLETCCAVEHHNTQNIRENTHLWTVWMFDACLRGDFDAVDACLPYADPSAIDEDHNTPVHHAVKHWGMVQVLLEAGYDPDVRNKRGFTPLEVACQHANNEAACTLLAYGAHP